MAILHDIANAAIPFGPNGAGSRTEYALDTNFTLASAGKSYGVRYVAKTTTTISYVMFFVSAAPDSAHDLKVCACAYGASTSRAGALIAASSYVDVSGGTADGAWIKATFSTPPDVTQGEPYWIVIGDPSGAASNYSILSRGSGNALMIPTSAFLNAFTSSDGFATNGSSVAFPPAIVIAFADGTFLGTSVTATAVNHTNNSYERGIKFTPDVDMVLMGLFFTGTCPNTAKIKVYVDGTNPGGTIFSGFNGGALLEVNDNASALNALTVPPCTLQGGTTYRIVIDFAANSTFPGYYAIEDYTHDEAALLACSIPGVTHTIENVGGTWDDNANYIPRMQILFQKAIIEPACDYPAESDVRDGVTYDSAAKTGTCHVPAAGDVESGVAVDAGTGTFVVPVVGDVESGVTYGNAGEFTGTLVVGGGGGHISARVFTGM